MPREHYLSKPHTSLGGIVATNTDKGTWHVIDGKGHVWNNLIITDHEIQRINLTDIVDIDILLTVSR